MIDWQPRYRNLIVLFPSYIYAQKQAYHMRVTWRQPTQPLTLSPCQMMTAGILTACWRGLSQNCRAILRSPALPDAPKTDKDKLREVPLAAGRAESIPRMFGRRESHTRSFCG